MNTLEIKTSNIKSMLEQFNNNLGGELERNTSECSLKVNNELAKGTITGMSFKGGISSLQYKIKFRDDAKIVLDNSDKNPIYFIYCSKGSIEHQWANENKRRKIDRFQTSILSTDSIENENELFFKNNEYCEILVIRIERKSNFINFYKDINADNNKFIELLSDITTGKYAYVGNYNLKIANQIDQLDSINETGLLKCLISEGLINLILAMEIQQHIGELNSDDYLSSLTKREMSLLKEVSDQIQKEPDYPYTINYLCQKTGLSAPKLQEGFKLMHNKTVTEFIKNTRLEAAEQLIKTTSMNISQIVYSIGFSSRSYFSKIFKEKYNCSPRNYQSDYNSFAIAS